MKKQFKHIIIQDFSTDGIIRKYRVTNKHDGYHLGTICYNKKWKKDVFEPSDNSMFDESCLIDIVNFMRDVRVK